MGEGIRCAFYLADSAGLEPQHITGMPDNYAVCADGLECWTFPIETRAAKLIGTFALYHRQPRGASSRDLQLAALFTGAAALVISHYNVS